MDAKRARAATEASRKLTGCRANHHQLCADWLAGEPLNTF